MREPGFLKPLTLGDEACKQPTRGSAVDNEETRDRRLRLCAFREGLERPQGPNYMLGGRVLAGRSHVTENRR